MIWKLATNVTALASAAGLSGCIIIDSDGGERTVVRSASDYALRADQAAADAEPAGYADL